MFSFILAQTAAAPAAAKSNPIMNFLPFILVIAIFYFLLMRPQQKQQKLLKKMIAEVKKGDQVVLAGGLYGTIIEVKPAEILVEVAQGVVMTYARSSIQSIKGYEVKK